MAKSASEISRKISYSGASDGDLHDAIHCDLPKAERKRIKKSVQQGEFPNAGPVAKAFFGGLFNARKVSATDESNRREVPEYQRGPVYKTQDAPQWQATEEDLLAVIRGQEPGSAYKGAGYPEMYRKGMEWARPHIEAMTAADSARTAEPRMVADLTTGRILNVASDYGRQSVSGNGMSRSW